MKKLFLSVVVIITTLASCSKGNDDDVPGIVTPELQKISFLTRNDTRASETTDNKQDYAVYAQYTTVKADWFMDNLELTHEDVIKNGSIYYWPANALDFYAYAYAPLNSSNINSITVVKPTESTKGTVKIGYTVPATANDEDFTVATPLIGRTASDGTVNYIFSRMMSKINITVSLDKSLSGYTLNVGGSTKLSVKSISGTVDITAVTPEWTTVPTDVDVEYITATTNSGTTPSTTVTYFIMPHSTAGYVVTIEGVSITKKGQDTINKPLTYTFDQYSNVTAFEAGKQYNLNFEINVLTYATFTSTVKKWVDAEIEGIL